jgi:hypothetical protein
VETANALCSVHRFPPVLSDTVARCFWALLLDSGDVMGGLAPSSAVTGPASPLVVSYRVRVSYTLSAKSGASRSAENWTPWVAAGWTVVPGSTVSAWGAAASWICTSPNSTDLRSSMLRAEFMLPANRTPVTATANVIGLGQFQLRINGEDVGGDANVPGWTTWSKRVLFSSYSVPASSLVVAPASNAIAVVLGNGMWNVPDPSPRYTKWIGSSGPRMLLLLLVVTLDNGSSFEVASTPGDRWSSTDGGPIVFTHQYAGEVSAPSRYS